MQASSPAHAIFNGRQRSIVRASIQTNHEAESGDRAWILQCPDGIEHVFVCDVAGRGSGVSAPADFLAHAARVLLCQGMSVALALETLDFAFAHCFADREIFASAFLASFGRRNLSYASAGHPDVLLMATDGSHRHLPATGPLIGVFQRPSMHQYAVRTASGDTLVAATDGILEAVRADGQHLGHPGLARCFRASLSIGAERLASQILDAVSLEHTVSDDYAIVAATVS